MAVRNYNQMHLSYHLHVTCSSMSMDSTLWCVEKEVQNTDQYSRCTSKDTQGSCFDWHRRGTLAIVLCGLFALLHSCKLTMAIADKSLSAWCYQKAFNKPMKPFIFQSTSYSQYKRRAYNNALLPPAKKIASHVSSRTNLLSATVHPDEGRDWMPALRRHFVRTKREKSLGHPRRLPYIIDGQTFNGTDPFSELKPESPLPRAFSANVVTAVDESKVGNISHLQNHSQTNRQLYVSHVANTSQWSVLEGHTMQSQRVVGGEIVWDDYDPGGLYFHQDGDFVKERIKNPYFNGKIKAESPSYLNPKGRLYRTGLSRDTHRRTDTGVKQRMRWGGTSPWNDGEDIERGNWTRPNDTFKEMLGSVDWERSYPFYHDSNYYKRSNVETGWGDLTQAEDSYWDVQFIGGPDTFPYTQPVGLNVTLTYNWVPWLCRKHPRKFGQPIKSFPFNLGGIEPLQLWFWPDGSGLSEPGFCSVKLVSRPGWCIPFPIILWAKSEYGEIKVGPVNRESAAYVEHSVNFCRLRRKEYGADLSYDPRVDLLLGPAGNVYIGVAVGVDYWEWDDGSWEFENWLKRQSAQPDDAHTNLLPASFTHSEWYENFKYQYVPDKHFSKYLPQNVDKLDSKWNRHAF